MKKDAGLRTEGEEVDEPELAQAAREKTQRLAIHLQEQLSVLLEDLITICYSVDDRPYRAGRSNCE